jgi:GTP-binding protein Era
LTKKDNESRCGFVAIVGRPNVGKSTLLNAIVGEKVSIVSRKAHTTRHRTLGIINRGAAQAIFIDTPGLQRDRKIADADLVLMVVDATGIRDEDRRLAHELREQADRMILVVNKIDLLHRRTELFALLQCLAEEFPCAAYVPVSAHKQENLDGLMSEIFERLPAGPALFPSDTTTDKDTHFRIAETIREKLLAALHQEVPYGLTVEVEHVGETDDDKILVHALIWLERDGHKPIVIGKNGRVLKAIGRAARIELTELLGRRVHLELWVKVRSGWSDSERELSNLGCDVS